MSVVGPTLIYELDAGGSVRLGGSLAAGATLTNGNTYRERLRVPTRATGVDVRTKINVSGGTPTVQLVPQTADIHGPNLTVSSVTSGLTTATNIPDDTEAIHSYTPSAEPFIDVVVRSEERRVGKECR